MKTRILATLLLSFFEDNGVRSSFLTISDLLEVGEELFQQEM